MSCRYPAHFPTAAPVQALERRVLMSGDAGGVSVQNDPPPIVDGLNVSGSAWTEAFMTYLHGGSPTSAPLRGYSLYNPLALRPLPWSNLNQIHVSFDGDMQVDAEDLRVFGVTVGEYPVASVRYELNPDGFSGTATWTLGRPLVNDRILLVIDGSENGPRDRVSGRVFDGDGDNQPGGDFRFRFNVVPGDGQQDGVVNAIDLGSVRAEQLTNAGTPGDPANLYYEFDDFNGDGRINAIDLSLCRARQLTRLPRTEPAPPPAPAGVLTLPTTKDLFSSAPILR